MRLSRYRFSIINLYLNVQVNKLCSHVFNILNVVFKNASITIFVFKDARSVSLYPYNRSQILQQVKCTK